MPQPLINKRGDERSADVLERTVLLRARAHRGEPVTSQDVASTSTTVNDAQIEAFVDRDYFRAALVPEIQQAKRSIHIANLEWDAGLLGDFLIDTLIEKKKKNPEMPIRLIMDPRFWEGYRKSGSHGAENLARLKEAGIEVAGPSYLTPILEHRKLAVIDGDVAMFGGTCFGEQYYATEKYRELFQRALTNDEAAIDELARHDDPQLEEPEHHDLSFRVHGEAVKHLQASFLRSWLYYGHQIDPGADDAEIQKRYFTPLTEDERRAKYISDVDRARPAQGNIKLKVFSSAPGANEPHRRAMLDVVRGAKRTLLIEMAYVMVPEFRQAIVDAAKNGVQVTVLTNGYQGMDHKVAWYALRGHYRELLDAGVQLYELNAYSHVKSIIADDRLVVCATGNPEWISWTRAFDVAAIADSPELAQSLRARIFDKDRRPERSKQIAREDASPYTSTEVLARLWAFVFDHWPL